MEIRSISINYCLETPPVFCLPKSGWFVGAVGVRFTRSLSWLFACRIATNRFFFCCFGCIFWGSWLGDTYTRQHRVLFCWHTHRDRPYLCSFCCCCCCCLAFFLTNTVWLRTFISFYHFLIPSLAYRHSDRPISLPFFILLVSLPCLRDRVASFLSPMLCHWKLTSGIF